MFQPPKPLFDKLEGLNCTYRIDTEAPSGAQVCHIITKDTKKKVCTARHSSEHEAFRLAVDRLTKDDLPKSQEQILQDNITLRQQNEALMSQLRAKGIDPQVVDVTFPITPAAQKLAEENGIDLKTISPANGEKITIDDIRKVTDPVTDDADVSTGVDSDAAPVKSIPFTPQG